MSSCIFSRPSIIAYASLAVDGFDFESFRKYCNFIPAEVRIVAEDVHPNAGSRPLWQNIINSILKDDVYVLIVPSLFHIQGNDSWLEPLIFKNHNVDQLRLISLAEGIDSFVEMPIN
jgi:hypothetical protein